MPSGEHEDTPHQSVCARRREVDDRVRLLHESLDLALGPEAQVPREGTNEVFGDRLAEEREDDDVETEKGEIEGTFAIALACFARCGRQRVRDEKEGRDRIPVGAHESIRHHPSGENGDDYFECIRWPD